MNPDPKLNPNPIRNKIILDTIILLDTTFGSGAMFLHVFEMSSMYTMRYCNGVW